MMKKILSVSAALVAIAILPMHLEAAPQKPPPSAKQFSREDFMVLNLDRGDDSTGAHLNESLKQAKTMVRDLDRSLRQLQQVDREFAKSKGKPDDHFLGPATDKIQQALKTAQQLEAELTTSRDELKDNIHQALIMAPQ